MVLEDDKYVAFFYSAYENEGMPAKRIVKKGKITQQKRVLGKGVVKPALSITRAALQSKARVLVKSKQMPESASAPSILTKSTPIEITREKIEEFKETKPPALIYPRGVPPAPSHLSPMQAGVTESGKRIMQVPRQQLLRREKKVFLVGTVHVSRESARKVEDTIATVLPDMVCLELDMQRFQAMQKEFGVGQFNVNQASVRPREVSGEIAAQGQKTSMQGQQLPVGRGATSGIMESAMPTRSAVPVGGGALGVGAAPARNVASSSEAAAATTGNVTAKRGEDYLPSTEMPSFRELMTLQGLLKWMQQEIGREFGVMPGSEMVSAFKAARKYGLGIGLIDRPVQQTIANMMERMPFKEKMKLLSYVIAAAGMLALKPLFGEKGTKAMSMLGEGKEIDLNKLERGEGVDGLMDELKKQFPTLYRALVDERNIYMCNNIIGILKTHADILVVVIGMGHMTEIKNILSARGIKVELVV